MTTLQSLYIMGKPKRHRERKTVRGRGERRQTNKLIEEIKLIFVNWSQKS